MHGELVVVDDVPGELAERVIEAFHDRPNDGFSLAVSGGETARRSYERLAVSPTTRPRVTTTWPAPRCSSRWGR